MRTGDSRRIEASETAALVMSSVSRTAGTCGRAGLTTNGDHSRPMTVTDDHDVATVNNGHDCDTDPDGAVAEEFVAGGPLAAAVTTDGAGADVGSANGDGVGPRTGPGVTTDDVTTPTGDDDGVSLDAATATGGAGTDVATANGDAGVALAAGVVATSVVGGRFTRASSLLPSMAVATIRTAPAAAR